MLITRFEEKDIEAIVSLFYETVHCINAKDYTMEQLAVWAPASQQKSKLHTWKVSFNQNLTYVARSANQIVGFSDMTYSGYLDRLYVHKDAQNQGIATALVDKLEYEAKKLKLASMTTDASITAKPFFEKRGFTIIQKQIVERSGVQLANYEMVYRLT